MADLTERQNEIYCWIRAHMIAVRPTYREVGAAFGMSVKGAYDVVKAIEKKGFDVGKAHTVRKRNVSEK